MDDQDIQLLRINDVSKLTSLAKSTINLWVVEGKFPKPIMLSSTIKVWRPKQIKLWIEEQETLNTNGE
jgi:prophage regulatory protein